MSDNTRRYNGWTNYETWCVNLWMSNDHGSYLYWQEISEKCCNNATDDANVASGIWTKRGAARFRLADVMESEIRESAPDLGASMFADLLGSALDEVNWHEIAQSWIDGIEYDWD